VLNAGIAAAQEPLNRELRNHYLIEAVSMTVVIPVLVLNATLLVPCIMMNMVPKKVLFSNDPVVPNIVGYLEAKRTGKTHKYNKTKPAIPKQIKAVQIAIHWI
jgi:hypothetical protein